jgi:D-alanyl-D-alanine carboxypeptidase/D-alanyl-D-alanine-endopeptidase (penicillin-binding protein 4)
MFAVAACWISLATALSLSQVKPQIDAILQRVSVNEHWGVFATAQLGRSGAAVTVVDFNSNQSFVPASITKLFATYAAFVTFTPQYRFNTTIRALAASKSLCFEAAGDPSVTYKQIAAALPALQNLNLARGPSAMVDPFAKLAPFPPTWEVGDAVTYYGATPSALVLNENTFTLRVTGAANGQRATLSVAEPVFDSPLMGEVQNLVMTDSTQPVGVNGDAIPFRRGVVLTGTIQPSVSVDLLLAVPRPNNRFVDAVTVSLGLATLPVQQVASCAGPAVAATSIVSEPLSTLLNWTLQTSDNLYAESFLRMFARNATNLDAAIATMHSVLPAEAVSAIGAQVDGSGLSRHNRIAPRAFEALIRDIVGHDPLAKQFISFLPQAGVSGSLRNRFIGSPAAKVTFAKTGGMTGVSSLAGVILNPVLVTFAVICNDAVRPGAATRADIDAIVTLLAQIDNLN